MSSSQYAITKATIAATASGIAPIKDIKETIAAIVTPMMVARITKGANLPPLKLPSIFRKPSNFLAISSSPFFTCSGVPNIRQKPASADLPPLEYTMRSSSKSNNPAIAVTRATTGLVISTLPKSMRALINCPRKTMASPKATTFKASMFLRIKRTAETRYCVILEATDMISVKIGTKAVLSREIISLKPFFILARASASLRVYTPSSFCLSSSSFKPLVPLCKSLILAASKPMPRNRFAEVRLSMPSMALVISSKAFVIGFCASSVASSPMASKNGSTLECPVTAILVRFMFRVPRVCSKPSTLPPAFSIALLHAVMSSMLTL